jgi:hypothetical protein
MRIAFNFCVHSMARHFAELSEEELPCSIEVNNNTIIELSSRKISSQIWQRQIIDLLAPDILLNLVQQLIIICMCRFE